MTEALDDCVRQPTKKAVQACAEWLADAIRLGWRREDLDFLEALWWKYHDHRGELKSSAKPVNKP